MAVSGMIPHGRDARATSGMAVSAMIPTGVYLGTVASCSSAISCGVSAVS